MDTRGASPKSLIPVRTNGALALLFVAVGVLQGWVLPAFLLPLSGDWAWLLLPAVVLTNPAWALLHETFHGTFHPNPRLNRAVGRVLAVSYGAPYHGLQFGHLTHHRYNRSSLDRTEVFDPVRQSRWGFAAGYYLSILGGLYMSEVAAGLTMLLPKPLIERLVRWKLAGDDPAVAAVRQGALAQLVGRCLPALRVDAAAILAFHGIGFWLYGAQAWLLLLALAGRGLLVSVTDNSYHYGTAVDDPHYAKNLRLGRGGAALLLHFNLHDVHHRFPYLPWRALPRVDGGRIAFAESYWPAIGRQFLGPIPVTRLRRPAG